MTGAGGSRLLAVAASLALHAGALALAWRQPPALPQQAPIHVTLLAPPALDLLTRPAPPSAEHGDPAGGGAAAMPAAAGAAAQSREAPVPAAIASAPMAGSVAADTATSTPALAQQTSEWPAIAAAAGGAPAPVAAAVNAAATAPATTRYTSGQVLATLKEAFVAHFHYPLLARRKGWEGEVTLALRVEIDGRLTGIQVVGSSGYRVLDNAAVDSLRRARALPLPGGALGGSLDMVLPVRYRLLDARV